MVDIGFTSRGGSLAPPSIPRARSAPGSGARGACAPRSRSSWCGSFRRSAAPGPRAGRSGQGPRGSRSPSSDRARRAHTGRERGRPHAKGLHLSLRSLAHRSGKWICLFRRSIHTIRTDGMAARFPLPRHSHSCPGSAPGPLCLAGWIGRSGLGNAPAGGLASRALLEPPYATSDGTLKSSIGLWRSESLGQYTGLTGISSPKRRTSHSPKTA